MVALDAAVFCFRARIMEKFSVVEGKITRKTSKFSEISLIDSLSCMLQRNIRPVNEHGETIMAS